MIKIDWKEEAISELRSYNSIKHSIESIRERIAILEAAFEHINSPNGAGTGSRISRDTGYVENIAKRSELKTKLRENTRIINNIDSGLQVLNDRERVVIFAAYINPKDWDIEKLSEQLSIERTAIYKLRNKALGKYIKAVYGA